MTVDGSVADAAREAFVLAMSRGSIVVAVVAALGAFVAWRYLPARAVVVQDALAQGDASRPAASAAAT